jgi:hypothetical protein
MPQMREITQPMKEVRPGLDDSSGCLADACTAFLSWLRLSVYMAIVSVAIVMSFHLKTKPSDTGTWFLILFIFYDLASID